MSAFPKLHRRTLRGHHLTALPLADSQDWLGTPARVAAAGGVADDEAASARRLVLEGRTTVEEAVRILRKDASVDAEL